MLDFRVETFLTVCETMNFTRAAQLLHITQPAVSQHIHALETQYGTRLFLYEGKQLRLTEAGQLFLQTAATMRHDVRRLQEALHQMDSRRHLRFGATLSIGEYLLPSPLLRLLTDDPTLQLRMITANTQELLRLMDQGELDFAIVEGSFDQQVYEGLVYCAQRFIPVAAPDYPFPGPVRRMADLLDARLLVREPPGFWCGSRAPAPAASWNRLWKPATSRCTASAISPSWAASISSSPWSAPGRASPSFTSRWSRPSWTGAIWWKSPWRTGKSATTSPFCGGGAAPSPPITGRYSVCCTRTETKQSPISAKRRDGGFFSGSISPAAGPEFCRCPPRNQWISGQWCCRWSLSWCIHPGQTL